MNYAAYLQSSHWKATRAKILERAGGVCERGGCRRKPSQVHHKNYARLGRERPSDLEALCLPCHQKEHPEKKMLPGWASFPIADYECPFCPSTRADLYLTNKYRRFVCTGCGADRREYRPGRGPRKDAPPQNVCGCGNLISIKDTEEGIDRCKVCRRAKRDPTRRPTLEELEADRRERERERVLRM